MKKLKNMNELRDDLLNHYNALASGSLKPKDAKEISNLTGKIINTCKIQLDYNSLMKRDQQIDFLEC